MYSVTKTVMISIAQPMSLPVYISITVWDFKNVCYTHSSSTYVKAEFCFYAIDVISIAYFHGRKLSE